MFKVSFSLDIQIIVVALAVMAKKQKHTYKVKGSYKESRSFGGHDWPKVSNNGYIDLGSFGDEPKFF